MTSATFPHAVSTEREPPSRRSAPACPRPGRPASRCRRRTASTSRSSSSIDLLAATKLVPEDKLALARGRAQQTRSLAHGARRGGRRLERGHRAACSPRGTSCRSSTSRSIGVDAEAARELPLHVLERIGAIPYALDGRQSADRGRRPGEPARARRASARDPAPARARRRLARGHPRSRSASSSARPRPSARAPPSTRKSCVRRRGATEDLTDLEADDGVSDVPLVRLVNSILFQAAEDGASDIHFEPQEDALVVRFRIDGVLQEMQRIPKRLMPGVTTRLKVLAKLDIAERRKPQDGRISLNAAAAGRMLDVRVATLPTVEGESLVMRLLDKSKKPPTLEELGLSDGDAGELSEIVAAPDRRAARDRARPAPVSRRRSSRR